MLAKDSSVPAQEIGFSDVSLPIGAVPLENLQSSGKLNLFKSSSTRDDPIGKFITLAINLATKLHEIHKKKIIHGAITPANILLIPDSFINADKIQVQILEPNVAMKNSSNSSVEQLFYISPEQTGRMSLIVDHRTDLYSLGVVFYQLLTGQLPFTNGDTTGLVHAHLAKRPVAPTKIQPDIPLLLSEIVLKLLAKDPQDRYQSTYGLIKDLESCLRCWHTMGRIDPFALGQNDVPDRLLLPHSLYGREKELTKLIDVLEDACKSGPQILFVSGDSGVGKTSLVRELLEPTIKRGGALIYSKSENHHQVGPYTAIIDALGDFVRQLLNRDPKQLAYWKKRLATALAGNTSQIVRNIPDLFFILDTSSNSPLEASDSRVLLSLALEKFLHAIPESDHPLVVFLDDAQWADEESLRMLHELTKYEDLQLMVIFAYRTDEALPEILEQLVTSAANDQHLPLTPLDHPSTNLILADVLYKTPEQVSELSALIYEKTAGNPLFLREYLRALHDRALITFDGKLRTWTWEIDRIRATLITHNVVELVRTRLKQLPEESQMILKVASMMGHYIESDHLAAACWRTTTTIDKVLQLAQGLGVLVPVIQNQQLPSLKNRIFEPRLASIQQLAAQMVISNSKDSNGGIHVTYRSTDAEENRAGLQVISINTYTFAHEQVRAATRLLLPSLNEDDLHRQIGRGLMQSMAIEQRQENIFLLARHLNLASFPSIDKSEVIELAKLNLEASRQALALVAHENALSFALAGMDFLNRDSPENAWQDNYDLMRDLHLTAAKAVALTGQFDQAEHLLEALDKHIVLDLDRATVTQVRMFAFYLEGRHTEAVASAVSMLRKLGVRLPGEPHHWHVLIAAARLQFTLVGENIETLVELPPMTNERSLKAIEIMATASISAASANPHLLVLFGLEIVRQTLEHGSSSLSAIGYAIYGMLLCGVFGQIDRGYAFGQLALRLIPRMRSKENRVFVRYFVYAHINHWKEHIEATLQPLRDLTTTGEFEYLAVAAGLYPYFTWFISGLDVSANERSIAENIHLLEPFKDTPLYYRYCLGQQYFQNLLGQADDPCQIAGEVYNEQLLLSIHVRENDRTTIFYLACLKLILCYMFENYLEAGTAAKLARDYSDGGIGTPLVPVLTFYESLACLERYPFASRDEARQLIKTVNTNQRKMRKWARNGPANCQHRFLLVKAELARLRGENGKAREFYDAAIQQAQSYNYLPELALAHEVAARFYLSIAQPSYADHHLRAAHRGYWVWGALGKVRNLVEKYPKLSIDIVDEKETPKVALSAYLDITSILKAVEALNSETSLSHLLDKLTAILVENAGAQVGYLLLPKGGQWQVVSCNPGIENVVSHKSNSMLQPAIAMSIVRQVARTRKPVLLNNVAAASSFKYDPNLSDGEPRSILCLPLLDQGELVGVFYMENRLTRNAFPQERMQALTMLGTQAAISLKNASLVAELQDAHENIRTSEQRFRLLFENAPLGIFEIDISGDVSKICTANKRAEATYGWSAAEFTTLDPAQLIPDESRHQIRQLVDSVRAGRTALLETTNQRRDGTVFPVRIIATPAIHQQDLRMIVAVEDITAERQRRSEAEAIDEERLRIAQEIHDGVAQDLASLRLKLSLWRDWVGSDSDRMQAELDQTRDTLDAAIDEIRRSIYALRPVALDEVGLYPALQSYIADFTDQHNISINLQIDIPEVRIPADLELPIFRSVQEALNNIAKHSAASLAWVHLTMEGDEHVSLIIHDNGRGFNLKALDEMGRVGHLGLKQMRERIEKVSGELTLTSQPGQGTQIRVCLPLG